MHTVDQVILTRRFGLTRDLVRRLVVLATGLLLLGIGISMTARSNLGLGPWSVLHDGISRHTGLALGTVDILVGIPVLILWIPLGERPGIATILSAFEVGLSINLGLLLIPSVQAPLPATALLIAGVLVAAFGSSLYLTANLGRGPRDGLMVGVHRRSGIGLGRIRTGIELTVLALGIVLGGRFGIGTVAYALIIGPALAGFLLVLRRRGMRLEVRAPVSTEP